MKRYALSLPLAAALAAFLSGCAATGGSAAVGEGMPTVILGPGEDTPDVLVISAPGGDVALATKKDKELMYDEYTYAGARRAGDFVFLSGVIAGPLPGEGTDVAAFKAQLARAFTTIRSNLEAAGATMADVVEFESFHVFDGPGFSGTANEQLEAMLEVKKEFFPEPYPTWTMLGIRELAEPTAVVEIKVTAYAPGG